MKNKYLIISLLLVTCGFSAYVLSYYFLVINPQINTLRSESKRYELNTYEINELKKIIDIGVKNEIFMDYHELTYVVVARKYILPTGWDNLWNFYGIHWRIWLNTIFSDEELLSILLSNVLSGADFVPIDQVVAAFYAKPLISLTCDEKFELVARVYFPQASQTRLDSIVKSLSNTGICQPTESVSIDSVI